MKETQKQNVHQAQHTAKKPSARIAKHAIKASRPIAKKRPGKIDVVRTVVTYLAWVLASFIFAQFAIALLFYVLSALHVPLAYISESVLQFVAALLVYALALLTAIAGPYKLFKSKTTLAEMGLVQRLPRWRDIGLAPLVFIACFILSAVTISILASLFPNVIDLTQKQAIGFQNLVQRYELIAAYVTLTILAPIAEELLFRGYLFGKLRRAVSAKVTIVLTALLFSSLHLIGFLADGEFQLQWSVMVDTFILAIGLVILREYTGSIWAGVLVHTIKNTIAFFVLFILPLMNVSITP
jgi:uncharacterized protein